MLTYAYIHTAIAILTAYKGAEPFHQYIKKYFSQYKKFGSRDRKAISQLCYAYFRLGKALREQSLEERILIALFLTGGNKAILVQLKPQWYEVADKDIAFKTDYIRKLYPFTTDAIFPFQDHLSAEIEYTTFCTSFLVQPHLYLRVRPGKWSIVQQKLQAAGLFYEAVTETCIQLLNTTKADDVLKIDEEAVIQDRSSQQVFVSLLQQQTSEIKTAWDCCAASGGKSILLKDYLPAVQLTVSDVRKSILINLQNRFAKAGIRKYKWFVEDISAGTFTCKEKFDLIICDAPCSGSGTWGRTPEQLYFFEVETIKHYSSLQQKIVQHAAKCLRKNGYFLYITCSVFEEENEAVAVYIQKNTSLQLLHMQYHKGYTSRADTLFTALFKSL